MKKLQSYIVTMTVFEWGHWSKPFEKEFSAYSAADAIKQARYHMRWNVGHTKHDGAIRYLAKLGSFELA